MVLARTRYRLWGRENASQTLGTPAVPSQWVRRNDASARTIFRRLLAAIADGSDHPCWRTNDLPTQLALLPPREQNRLLSSGRVTEETLVRTSRANLPPSNGASS
jgi:hypothetical protein